MADHAWIKEFPAAISVCSADGTLLEINERAIRDEGEVAIGTNLLDCHPEPARSKVAAMLASGEKNIYTIEKKGVKKLIFQSPWYENGVYAGFVELSLEIPFEMPHFIRK